MDKKPGEGDGPAPGPFSFFRLRIFDKKLCRILNQTETKTEKQNQAENSRLGQDKNKLRLIKKPVPGAPTRTKKKEFLKIPKGLLPHGEIAGPGGVKGVV